MLIKRYLKKKFGFIESIDTIFNLYRIIFHRKYRKKEKYTLQKLKQIEGFSDEEIYEIQGNKLLALLKYAYNNTVYYKNTFDSKKVIIDSVESLKKIPILTKEIIRENLNDLISKKFVKELLVKRNTGGSTGKPLEFYSDNMSGYIDNAHHWYLYSLMGYEKGDIIIGSGGSVIPESLRDENIFWLHEDKNSVWGEYDFSVLYITEKNIKYYIDKLIDIKPSILRGYPSFFDKLAIYILNNDIDLKFKVKGINLTAEMCSLSQRINIEKAFSSMVYFEYGHTEICLYCYTQDETYIYRSSPIYGYIEVLNEDGEDVKIGETGKIIVTGFNNYGMPFIRYDTGDMGEVNFRNGGEIHFKKIVGRNQDFIVSKNGDIVYLTGLIFGQHLKAFKNIKQWQLKQDKNGLVQISIVKDIFYKKNDEAEIISNFKSITDIDLSFLYVDKIPLTKRGKHLFLIQDMEKGVTKES